VMMLKLYESGDWSARGLGLARCLACPDMIWLDTRSNMKHGSIIGGLTTLQCRTALAVEWFAKATSRYLPTATFNPKYLYYQRTSVHY